MADIYKNMEDYNPIKNQKILILFIDMIADLHNNNKPDPVVTELFIRRRKLNIDLVFTKQSCFEVPEDIRLNYNYD